jgi:peptidoglycan-N-acetylglucosamine deacetylase
MLERKIVLALVLAISIVNFNCKKFDKPNGEFKAAGVALTFDDDRIDSWFKYLPLLDSACVKATFYISNYNRFSADKKKKLLAIKNAGHEIAFHTTNHLNMEEYVYKNKHTIEELMTNEVEAGLKLLNKDGYYPTTFAYPYGVHNAIIDKALMRYFKSVRALNGTQNFAKSLVSTTNNNSVIYGLGIDKGSKRSDADIDNTLYSAIKNKTCLVTVAHDINTNSSLSVSVIRLKKIIKFVKDNNMKFYTIAEISN